MATFGDLKTYVDRDGWTEEPNLARGRARTGDHWRYRKDLPDGTILRTKVSHSLRDEIPRHPVSVLPSAVGLLEKELHPDVALGIRIAPADHDILAPVAIEIPHPEGVALIEAVGVEGARPL